MSVRSRQLIDERSHDWALSCLSGLMIGADVRGALPLFAAPEAGALISDGGLNARYAPALRREGIGVCAPAGLPTLCQP